MTPPVLPRPQEVRAGGGTIDLGPLELELTHPTRGRAAAARLQTAWPAAVGSEALRRSPTTVRLAVEASSPRPLPLGVDESYQLSIGASGIDLRTRTEVGARRGVETLLQLVAHGRAPVMEVDDAPHLPWRGLLVDVCRHWIGLDALLATVDALAAAKANVLHLHLSDDHGFRLECRTHPRLHEAGSDGRWLSHDDIARLVEHAHAAGVRVVPELDVPGHVTSWLVAYPELAATPGPFALRTTPGIATDALHPERPEVRRFVAEVLAEVADLFPDRYLHVGGDEVHESAWPGLDVATVQPEFTRWVTDEVRSLGKVPIVWDEAWHPGLAPDVVTQVWRGHALLRRTAAEGRPTLFSTPYYLDLSFDPEHHRVHPLVDADGWARARARLHTDPTLGPLGHAVAAVEAAQWPIPPDTPTTWTRPPCSAARRACGASSSPSACSRCGCGRPPPWWPTCSGRPRRWARTRTDAPRRQTSRRSSGSSPPPRPPTSMPCGATTGWRWPVATRSWPTRWRSSAPAASRSSGTPGTWRPWRPTPRPSSTGSSTAWRRRHRHGWHLRTRRRGGRRPRP
ncbi:MAG: family 20 glycosylhydrolase [Acidimicrobiales bacterium]